MYYLLLGLGLACMAAGMFIVGFAIPIRETNFGAALLVVGSVAFTGGLIAIGLAAAVAELRHVVGALKTRAATRPLRPVDRKDGGEKRPAPPRMAVPPRAVPEAPYPAPRAAPEAPYAAPSRAAPEASYPVPPRPAPEVPYPAPARAPPPMPPPAEAPPMAMPAMPPREAPPGLRNPGPEWLRRAVAEIEAGPNPADTSTGTDYFRDDSGPVEAWPRLGAAAAPEPRREEQPAVPRSLFDMAWDRPSPTSTEQWAQPPVEPLRPAEARTASSGPQALASPSIASAPPRPEPRPAILKSGVIDEMAYTLFTDGSIEADMPDGTMRFGSIDELRAHLEQHEG